MRKYLYYVLMFVLMINISSCKDSYFEKDTTSNISDKDLKEAIRKNGDLAKALVSGMYSNTINKSLDDGGRHDDDFGQKAIDLTSDIISGDMAVISNDYGWFYDDEELKSSTKTKQRTEIIWTFYYRLIKSSNDVLAAFEDENVIPSEGAQTWAQAKTMRAYAYYNLVNLFSKGYEGHESDACVIIYGAKDDKSKGLSTVKQVYDFVKKDLEQAVEVLSKQNVNRISKAEIDLSISSGLLAYTYLATGEYAKAYEAADNALSAGSVKVLDANGVLGGFNSVEIPSWMWCIDITKENSGGLRTWWGQVDIYTYSYAYAGMAKVMDANLYAQIQKNDVRKYQFDKKLRPSWKFYNADRVGGQQKWESDVHFMRAAEMILIKAEAKARQGQDASAEIASLIEQRRADAVTLEGVTIPEDAKGLPTYGSTLDDIYLQWRIELWGEGQGLITLKRFKKTIKRGDNHPELKGVEVSYDDSRLTFPIPELEIVDNPNIN